MRKLWLIPLLLLCSGQVGYTEDSPPITLQITNQIGYAPAQIDYTIRVEPHFENITLCWGWWSDTSRVVHRRSCEILDGQYSPRIFQRSYTWVGPGSYMAFAAVYRVPNRLTFEANQPFIVLVRGDG